MTTQVLVLIQKDPKDTEVCGVFSSIEVAQRYAEDKVNEDMGSFAKYPAEGGKVDIELQWRIDADKNYYSDEQFGNDTIFIISPYSVDP